MDKPVITITMPLVSAGFLPEAEALAVRTDHALKGVSERLSQGGQTDPAWQIYRQDEIEKRRNEKSVQVRAQLVSELESLARQIETTIRDVSTRLRRALRPLQTSPLSSEQAAGQYFEGRASRRAKLMTVSQLIDEYSEALRNSQIDFASELISYGELMFSDGVPGTAVSELKLKHFAALGVAQYPGSIQLLVKTLENVNFRKMLLAESRDPSEASNIHQLEALARDYATGKRA